ncbi:uncharacterized protein HMPREF1541_07722 [Cyphellophora europaea CBS 101466]|uniref:Cytochrome b561 domain-containing protein n=1 Tax=Cyphellophora europaea (strain CBS 101466) TaxID=1220924 RepID=W2RQU9_CYPE1|nr:uncharacterized protein HMPREF1541_07722 [Cyphellophora europaea CBS 101466]ETN38098.1 hypothetical protein HMPREF1541_07722 [Cyphellophora europaea CBS 101466]
MNWATRCLLASTTLLSAVASAYRPVQFVKHTGEAGRADQAFSLTQHYNESTGENDLWVRMEAFRYSGDAKGWAALGLGPWMTGALMFILYGDPTAPGAPLTVSVRTADGHHPPLPLTDVKPPFMPDVDVTYAQFDEYSGGFNHADMGKPSHVAVADFVVRGYDGWHAVDVSNTSTRQPFIWSSNFKQDFEGDYSVDRHIDMHMFGLGFGFLFVDLQNAAVPEPMYGEIRDTESHYGISEIGDPDSPTDEELASGKAYIDRMTQSSSGGSAPPRPEATSSAEAPPLEPEHKDEPAGSGAGTLNPNPEVEQPVHSPKQWNLRSFMWHLHGALMVFAFLIMYPLGTYLLRSGRPTAFNFHWTIQALGSAAVGISAIIGYFNSHSISITHQYAGLVIVLALASQILLGWRHHVFFVQTKGKNWLSPAHIWLGRVVLPLGFVNIITGLKLRQYGWFTILLVVVVMLVELVGLFWYVRGARARNARIDAGAGNKGMPIGQTGAEAEEEYFQLAGDDDEFSDSDGEEASAGGRANGAQSRAEEKREQSKRLAQLDKV